MAARGKARIRTEVEAKAEAPKAKAKRIPAEVREAIVNLYWEEQWTYRDLAIEYGISPGSVYRILAPTIG